MELDAAREVIERGQRCANLLANETFVWLVNEQTAEHLAALVASPPGPAGLEQREYHHLLQYALTQLVATLRGHIETGRAQADALEMLRDEQEDLP